MLHLLLVDAMHRRLAPAWAVACLLFFASNHAEASRDDLRVSRVLVGKEHHLLFDTDTSFKNYRVEVYRNDGQRLFRHQLFSSAKDAGPNDDAKVVGLLERLNVVLYAGKGVLYAYDYTTNQERRVVMQPAGSPPVRFSAYDSPVVDPAAGLVFWQAAAQPSGGPRNFQFDLAANTSTALDLPGEARAVRRQADGSYLLFENSSTWKDDVLLKEQFKLLRWEPKAGTTPKVLLQQPGNVSDVVGEHLVVRNAKTGGLSLVALESAKVAVVSGVKGTLLALKGDDASFLAEDEQTLTRFNLKTKKAVRQASFPKHYALRWLVAQHPRSGDLLYFNHTTRQFTLPGAGDSASWPLVSLQSEGKPVEAKFTCRYQAVLRESVDTKGEVFSSTAKGSYSWPHYAQRDIDVINTAWEDLNDDGAPDLVIQYVNWRPELAAVDVVFGDGKGGFTGYRRLKCDGKLYTAAGVLRTNAKEVTDNQPWVGCHVRFNKVTKALDVYDVKDLAKPGSTFQPVNDCEQSLEKDGTYAYRFLAQHKPGGGPWQLMQDNQPLTRAIEFKKRHDHTDYNRDGRVDSVRVEDGKRRLPGDTRPVQRAVIISLAGAAGSEPVSFPLPGDVRVAQPADFNGDDYPDLAVAFTDAPHRLMIVYGGATARDFEPKTYRVKASLQSLLPVDLDGDGRAELTSRNGGALDVLSFDEKRELAREQRLDDLRFSEFTYASFDRINLDGTLDYAAISLFDTPKGEVTVTPYLGEFSGGGYVLHGAKQKWMDFEGQFDAYMKEYNAWKARQEAAAARSRGGSCKACGGVGARVGQGETECRSCGSCGGSGRFTTSGNGVSSRYETWNGRDVMVTRFYNTYASSRCSTCDGSGEVCYRGYGLCTRCGGSGREPEAPSPPP